MNRKISESVKENSNLPVIKPGFEKLRIWKKAYDLMVEIFGITKNLPPDERFRIKDQIERACSSVVDAIAEGYSTYYYNDKIKSFYLARREAGETQSHCKKLEAKRYISSEKCIHLIQEYEGLIRGINALINRIKEQRDSGKRTKVREQISRKTVKENRK